LEFIQGGNSDTDAVPVPKVIIDQDSDPDATVVEVTFGDRLGALLDTVCFNNISHYYFFVFVVLEPDCTEEVLVN
jgi:hypothetical protein